MILEELAARLDCAFEGDGAVEIARVAGIEEAATGDLTFLANPRYTALLDTTRASAVIVRPDTRAPLPRLVSKQPYLTFARAATLLHPPERPPAGVHPTAQVDPSAELGADIHVGALCVIGEGVRLGRGTALHPQVVLYAGVEVGEDCVLHSGVQVREQTRIGDRVIVQNGSVLGADGFGFARDESGNYEKIPHIGRVIVEDDVEIGALTAIDRASLGITRIGRGTKIDNLVQVGHSVQIGESTVLAGQVGIAGSTRIGNQVTLAGQVGVAGHLSVGDGATASAQTGIPSSLEAGAFVSGYPAIDNRAWLKSSVVFARLPELSRRVRQLERMIEKLQDEE